MFTSLLIANRGEIACRIIRTARRMGLTTVAVYSQVDANSLHVTEADQAFCIGPAPASESYLNIDAILAVAKQCGAEAIHPGYGFLSENVAFALACAEANIVFVGPSIPAMQAMSSKQSAKQRLEKTSVPLTPGYHGTDQSDQRLFDEAKRLGFPVLLKAACGGGGKGMREVFKAEDFQMALSSARREAMAYFADDAMILEALIQAPRHIELQIMADNHGNIVHLYERDCSIQRRHQKIIEEAPASHLSAETRQKLASAAIDVAQTIDYRGAGTVEFIMDTNEVFYFMEMNTRLQVEHPVTEMITGLDLVEWQLRIAANETLPLSQAEITTKGHAIECRICAEDPAHDWMPSTGEITFLKEPREEHLRVDTGIRQHSVMSPYYDSMLAKCIAWGETREQARTRLNQALKAYCIGGVKTNLGLLQQILQHPRFIHQQLNTAFLEAETWSHPTDQQPFILHAAACLDYWISATTSDPLQHDTFAWQLHLQSHWIRQYQWEHERVDIAITPISHQSVTLAILAPQSLLSPAITYGIRLEGNMLYLTDSQTCHRFHVTYDAQTWVIYTPQGPFTVTPHLFGGHAAHAAALDHQLTAPMPGKIVSIFKQKGDAIRAGEALLVLEAMKMEHTVRAPHDGTIRDIFYAVGSQVNEGAMLVALEEV